MFRGKLFGGLALLVALFRALCCEAAQTYGLYQSVDGGTTWRENAHPFKANRIDALHTEGDRVWAGSERGLFVSRDSGKSWREVGPSRIGSVRCIASTRDTLILGTKVGLWSAQKSGDWSESAEFKGQFIRAVATDGQKLFAGTDHGEVFISTNKAATWKLISDGLPPHSQIFELKTSPSGQLYAALYSRGLFVLRDGDWMNLGAPYAFTILPIDDSLSLAGGNPGGILRTDDGGKFWSPVSGLSLRAPTWTLYRDKKNLFCGASGKSGLYRSTDFGRTWNPVAEREFATRAVVAITAVGDTLLLATVNSPSQDAFEPAQIAGFTEK